jgi:ABC-type iron transport system FetAB ATPase subunit
VFLIGRVASMVALLWQQNAQPGQPVSQAADEIRLRAIEYAMSNLARSSNAVFDRMQFPENATHESQRKAHDDAFLARVVQTPRGARGSAGRSVPVCQNHGSWLLQACWN